MRFAEKLIENAVLILNNKRVSPHAFMAQIHSTVPGEEALKLGGNLTHWDPIFKSAIPDGNRRKREDGIERYMSPKSLQV